MTTVYLQNVPDSKRDDVEAILANYGFTIAPGSAAGTITATVDSIPALTLANMEKEILDDVDRGIAMSFRL